MSLSIICIPHSNKPRKYPILTEILLNISGVYSVASNVSNRISSKTSSCDIFHPKISLEEVLQPELIVCIHATQQYGSARI